MVSFISFCDVSVLPMPQTYGAAAECVLVYPQLQRAIAWGCVLALLAAALGVLQQAEVYRRLIDRRRVGAAVGRDIIRQRLPAVWSIDLDPRVVHPPSRGAGGAIGRVPPRPAAGSTLPMRLAQSGRARRR